MIDILKFFFVYCLVLFAFACGLNQLFWYYATMRATVRPFLQPPLALTPTLLQECDLSRTRRSELSLSERDEFEESCDTKYSSFAKCAVSLGRISGGGPPSLARSLEITLS